MEAILASDWILECPGFLVRHSGTSSAGSRRSSGPKKPSLLILSSGMLEGMMAHLTSRAEGKKAQLCTNQPVHIYYPSKAQHFKTGRPKRYADAPLVPKCLGPQTKTTLEPSPGIQQVLLPCSEVIYFYNVQAQLGGRKVSTSDFLLTSLSPSHPAWHITF